MSDDLEIGTGERGRFRYEPKKKKLVPCKKARKLKRVHNVIDDTLPAPIESMATPTRQMFDSKSAYRRHLKAHGFKEAGTMERGPSFEDLRKEEEKEELERRQDIEKSYFDVKYGRVEFDEQEKENHLREERACRQNNLRTKMKAPY